jgi:hypothetical protein
MNSTMNKAEIGELFGNQSIGRRSDGSSDVKEYR